MFTSMHHDTAFPPVEQALREPNGLLAAGGDLIVVSGIDDAEAMVAAIHGRALADPAFRGQVDEAALRVLEAKSTFAGLRCDG